MKLGVLVVTVVMLVALAVSAQAVDWTVNPANGHRYAIVQGDTWTAAETLAISIGGHLVTIRSQAENNWVFNWTLSITDSSVYRAWIGLHQPPGSVEPNGGWVWTSGEPVNYTNWQTTTGEPNNYYGPSNPEDWVQIFIRKHDWDEVPSYWNDTWHDRPNTTDVGIVEIVPEPSTLLAGVSILAGVPLFFRRRRK